MNQKKIKDMIVKEKKAPGEKLIKKMSLRTKWILTSILSFLIIGLGLSFFVFSWNRLQIGFDKATWGFMVLVSLAVFYLGLVFYGNSIMYATEIRSRKIWKQKQKDLKKKRFVNKGTEKLNIQKSPQS
jgi:TRAP-type C4-dicarboxylate transport system permease small subunit